MKNSAYLLLNLVLIYSCNVSLNNEASAPNFQQIFQHDSSFATYYNSLNFSKNFIPLDLDSNIINKGDFLRKISMESFVPSRFDSNNKLYYKLYRANPPENYMTLIKALVDNEYSRYKMEEKPIPDYNFVDLSGIKYNKKTTLGKIVLLKLWFIGCVPCVKEMPALNKLVESYKTRKDVVFISLAFDKEDDLKKFLQKKDFNYAVIANQKNYIIEKLHATTFPTHIIINKQGLIVKVVSTYEEMEYVLKKEALN